MKETIQTNIAKNIGMSRITALELSRAADVIPSHPTAPKIRAVIRQLIKKGAPIGSDRLGYFTITEREELEDVLENLQSRCDAIQERIVDITLAYNGVLNNRHTNHDFSMKDRCRYYVIYIAETSGLPYQAVWTMAYRRLQKITGVDLINLPPWYQGSVLNYCANKSMLDDLHGVLIKLERSLI